MNGDKISIAELCKISTTANSEVTVGCPFPYLTLVRSQLLDSDLIMECKSDELITDKVVQGLVEGLNMIACIFKTLQDLKSVKTKPFAIHLLLFLDSTPAN
ncbi:triosephosphate isomerase-like [Ochlerotatus camptorhynchus]|uniref:triosephosphate isomerase-like n=1 Tax=Ochlerotatus camptorhynchus TaxID=644619 RepID=UPI0031E2E98E